MLRVKSSLKTQVQEDSHKPPYNHTLVTNATLLTPVSNQHYAVNLLNTTVSLLLTFPTDMNKHRGVKIHPAFREQGAVSCDYSRGCTGESACLESSELYTTLYSTRGPQTEKLRTSAKI